MATPAREMYRGEKFIRKVASISIGFSGVYAGLITVSGLRGFRGVSGGFQGVPEASGGSTREF